MSFFGDLGTLIDEYAESLHGDEKEDFVESFLEDLEEIGDAGVLVMDSDEERIIMAKNEDGELIPLPSTFILTVNKVLDYAKGNDDI